MIYLLSDQIKIKEIMFDLDIARLQTDVIQQQYQKSFITRLYHPSNKVLSTVVPLPISNTATTNNNSKNKENTKQNNKEKKEFHPQVEVELEEMKECDEEKGEPYSPMHIPVYDDNEYDNYISSSKKQNNSIKTVAGWNTILPQLSEYSIPPPHSPHSPLKQQQQQLQQSQEQSQQQQPQLQQQLVQRSSSLYYDPHSPLWLPLSSLHQLATSSNIHSASVSVSTSSKHHRISSQHTTTTPIVPLNSTKHWKSNRNDAILSDMDEIDSIFKSSSWSMSTLSSNMNRPVSPYSATSSYIVSKPAAANSGGGSSSSSSAAAGDDQVTTGIGESE